jgi:hypothetical protein
MAWRSYLNLVSTEFIGRLRRAIIRENVERNHRRVENNGKGARI